MRILIASIAALALSACAGMTPQQIAGTASAGLSAAATLARSGTVEERIAPVVSRNALSRQRSTAMLRDGRIDPASFRVVFAHHEAARAALDAAAVAPTAAAVDAHLAAAVEQIAAAEKLMEASK